MNGVAEVRRALTLALLAALFASPALAQSPAVTPDTDRNVVTPTILVGGDSQYENLQGAVDAAPEGSTIEVRGGIHAGPIVIAKALSLIGTDDAIIDGFGDGTVIRIENAPRTVLQGFIIQNSGNNFDKEDSAVYVDRSDAAEIRDNQLLNTLFGVNVAQSHGIVITDNLIVGKKDIDSGIRGDGIKVWYSHQSLIDGNRVENSRDLLVWYSNEAVVRDNEVKNGRYGFHFMNSDDGVAERNVLIDNSVGIYLMYGRNFVIRDNLIRGSRGPSGHGIGLKEIDGVAVVGNVIHDNRVGVYIDNSPLSPDVYGSFEGNLIAYNDSGLGVLPSTQNNVFTTNSLIENLEQVTVFGGGAIGSNQWAQDGVGNFWSDYVGYDANGDGIGDVSYRSEDLSEQLMSSWPILQLYRFSVAESAVDFGARAVPVFRADPKLVDPAPLVEPVVPANVAMPDEHDDQLASRLWSMTMLALAAGSLIWVRVGRRQTERLIGSAHRRFDQRNADTTTETESNHD
jgi:nitrous oxidase accessory protein